MWTRVSYRQYRELMIIIGEKINATIPKIKEAILKQDGNTLAHLAVDQEDAGADYIDINVGTGEGSAHEEIRTIEWLVNLVKDTVKGLLCVDSADPKVLESGLKAGKERVGMVNSVKATDRNIAEVLPLVAEYGVSVIGLAMDESGIPNVSSERLKACEKILTAAEEYGISAERIYFDPLVMPVSTDTAQGMVTLESLRDIKNTFPNAKSVLAVSNVSFGLPKRHMINSALLHMAQFLSVDAVILNTLNTTLMGALRAGEAVLGRDRHCRKYTRSIRKS